MNSVESKIINLLKQTIKRDLDFEITGETNLIKDISIDSLDLLLLFGEICDEFGIDVDETELASIETVNDIVSKVTAKLNEQKEKTYET
ncbi:phosphopantetheine-binding protein [Ruminiclostridium josui]|uniref:phosphopantetheine-binding protein n=1 Tax=Ruminiclostridium josui TaxID=1499 RepID=UPI00046462BB|nr:phosphopantetheine-binding protein [Ruminiclostridium josui]